MSCVTLQLPSTHIDLTVESPTITLEVTDCGIEISEVESDVEITSTTTTVELQAQSAIASSRATLVSFGNTSVGASITDRYLTPWYGVETAKTVSATWRLPTPGTLKNLRIRQNEPQGNGNNIVYTVRKNGVPSGLAVTMASTDVDGSNTTNSEICAAGDVIDILVTKASSVGTAPRNVVAVMELF